MTDLTPGALALLVWNCEVRLVRCQIRNDGWSFDEALLREAYRLPEVAAWLADALEAAGGARNVSGVYPLARPLPAWLAAEVTMAALGR